MAAASYCANNVKGGCACCEFIDIVFKKILSQCVTWSVYIIKMEKNLKSLQNIIKPLIRVYSIAQ